MRSIRNAAFAAAAGFASATAVTAQVPSPKEVFGHQVGGDYFLANYTQLTDYWERVAASSDRVELEVIGQTAYGQDHIVAIISSPANLARRETLRQISESLTLGRASEERATELAETGRAVIWIDAGMHATESVAAQNIIELVYRMASRDDREVRRILDEVVLVVCPANPDGMEMVANAYMATKRVGGLPVLYQRWVGHDNNRDYYAGNVPETRNIQRMLYRHWYPQVVYNHHQTAPRGTIIFTPPFRDPFNYNVDPLVIRGIELVSAHMNHRFTSEGKPGVISRSGASYSTWWNGGLRTTVYFHNMVGILTETFGSPNPTPLQQTLSRRLPYSDYPDPIASQTWHARQSIEYLQTANFAILDLAARYRREFLTNAWRMARRSIDRGSRDHWTPTPDLLDEARAREQESRKIGDDGQSTDPVSAFEDPELRDTRHYLLPASQGDFAAATRLVRRLRRGGVEVRRTLETVELPWAGQVPKGSYLIHAAQAFRPHLRDMLEPQWHPDDVGDGGEPVRPYDSAGWTLSMQMGVEVVKVRESLDVASEPVSDVEVAFRPGRVMDGRAGWLIDHADSNHFGDVQRLLAVGAKAHWLNREVVAGGRSWPAGSVFVTRDETSAPLVRELARDSGVSFVGVDAVPPGPARALRKARIGLFDVWGGNMPTGWTEWVLQEWGLEAELVFGDRVDQGELDSDFDVLIFHTGLPPATRREGMRRAVSQPRRSPVTAERLGKLRDALPPFEDWSTLESRATRLGVDKSIPALREFVENGGTIIAFGREASTLAAHFDLPIEEGVWLDDEETGERRRVSRSEFFIPGSLVNVDVDVSDPLGYGMDPRHQAMFRRSPVFSITDPTRAQAVVSYVATGDVLASGWAIGEELIRGKAAAVRANLGTGQVILFGADMAYRGQPVATFKLLFNAIQSAASTSVQSVEGS